MNEPNPPPDQDSSRTAFWTKRWAAGRTPWDLGGIPRELSAFLGRFPTGKRALIPGCGSGYEVRAFHEAGHSPTAIEFSPPAVETARRILGDLGSRVIHGNFFKHDFAGECFQIVYERGFLCSLPRDRWPDYALRMRELIPPGGRLVGLFLYGEEPEPPPFPLSPALAAQLLGDSFRLVRDDPVDPSVPVYAGLEHWQEWERTH